MDIAAELAAEKLQGFVDNGTAFYDITYTWLEHTLNTKDPNHPKSASDVEREQNQAIIGMMFVYDTFNTQLGGRFYDEFNKLTAGSIQAGLYQATMNPSKSSIMRSVYRPQDPRIPDDQVHLREGLAFMNELSPASEAFRLGANAMYGLIVGTPESQNSR